MWWKIALVALGGYVGGRGLEAGIRGGISSVARRKEEREAKKNEPEAEKTTKKSAEK